MDSFGERLKSLRISRGLSQEYVAGELGVSPQAVSKWENGKSLPDSTMIVPLAQLLHASADELLGNELRTRSRYEEWDGAIPEDDPEQAAVTALRALSQFPGDAHFLYRLAQAEHMSAALAKNREDRLRFLRSAERHYQAILLKFPEFEEASVGLARVLNSQGRRFEAEATARRLPAGKLTGNDVLLETLQGEAWEKHWQYMIDLRVSQLYQLLLLNQTPENLTLAEQLLEVFPGKEGDRLERLADICHRRALLLCRAGQEDAAMTELCRLKELMARKKAYDEGLGEKGMSVVYDENMEPLPRKPGWLNTIAVLKNDRELKPLAGRPEFRELLRLADQLGGKGEA